MNPPLLEIPCMVILGGFTRQYSQPESRRSGELAASASNLSTVAQVHFAVHIGVQPDDSSQLRKCAQCQADTSQAQIFFRELASQSDKCGLRLQSESDDCFLEILPPVYSS